MKNFKLYAFSLFLSLAVLFLPVVSVVAQGVNDFVITSFDASYKLDNKDPQGRLTTTEVIDLDFSGQNRGILRSIPMKYRDKDTNPTIISVERDGITERFITYEDNDNLVVKIGDANVVITGVHSYTITYVVENVITFYDDYDELYWDVNGDQWLQTFESVTASVKFPGASINAQGIKCFTGAFGSTEENCQTAKATNVVSFNTAEPLRANETLSIVIAFNKGYFTPPSWWEQNGRIVAGSLFVLVELALLGKAYKKWEKYGKDYKPRGVTVPFFGRPKRVSVMQAAYVVNNRLTPKHLTASIIDLAIRGYIKINETVDKKPKHELEFVGTVDDKLTIDEKKLLNGLFDKLEKGQKIKLEDQKQKLSKTLTELMTLVDKQTKKKGYYEVSPKSIAKLYRKEFFMAFLVIVLGFISSAFIGTAGKIIGVAIFALMILLGGLMTKRSREGVMLKEHMDGLNLYLKTAQKERLEAHDAVNAPLAPKDGEPVRDVKFFEKLLPYAVVYGVEKTWAKAFADIYQEPPDWYNGRWTTFNTLALASSIGNTTKVASSAFSAPSSSGGSGFSGGGAGGGGGGGGGGGW